jgi:hypothetical protein
VTQAHQSAFLHSVFFWLRDGGTSADAQQLADGCRRWLSGIPGVRRLYVGTPAGTPRDVVDSTYAVGLHVELDDAAAQDAYQEHPDHLRFIDECAHLWSRVRVYDTVVPEATT